MRCCKKLKSGDTLCQLQSTEDEEEGGRTWTRLRETLELQLLMLCTVFGRSDGIAGARSGGLNRTLCCVG